MKPRQGDFYVAAIFEISSAFSKSSGFAVHTSSTTRPFQISQLLRVFSKSSFFLCVIISVAFYPALYGQRFSCLSHFLLKQ